MSCFSFPSASSYLLLHVYLSIYPDRSYVFFLTNLLWYGYLPMYYDCILSIMCIVYIGPACIRYLELSFSTIWSYQCLFHYGCYTKYDWRAYGRNYHLYIILYFIYPGRLQGKGNSAHDSRLLTLEQGCKIQTLYHISRYK